MKLPNKAIQRYLVSCGHSDVDGKRWTNEIMIPRIAIFMAGLLMFAGCSHGVTTPSSGTPPRTSSTTHLASRYGELTHRTILLAPNLPNATCPLPPEELSPDEAARWIKETLAKHNVACIDIGQRFVRIVPIVNTTCRGYH